MSSNLDSYLKNKLTTVPLKPGIYRFLDDTGDIIYIGASKCLQRRIKSYFGYRQRPSRLNRLVSTITDFEWECFSNSADAFEEESKEIRFYQPEFNRSGKTDPKRSFVQIMTNKTPKMIFVSKENIRRDCLISFGFSCDLKTLIKGFDAIRSINPFCAQESKIFCHDSELGLCLASCQGKVSKKENFHNLTSIINVIHSNFVDVESKLQKRMQEAAQRLKFETANVFKERLDAVRQLRRNYVCEALFRDYDIVSHSLRSDSSFSVSFFIEKSKVKEYHSPIRLGKSHLPDSLKNFIKSFYGSEYSAFLPEEIRVPTLVTEKESLEDWLANIRGDSVKLIVHPVAVFPAVSVQ
ncbi:MAG: GIY-YIG nuclease family protein [Promethearchaeota archaeon]